MLKKRIMGSLAVALIAVSMSVTAFAAKVDVKNETIKYEGINVTIPQIKGAKGGAIVDEKVNMQILANTWNGLGQIIARKPLAESADEQEYAKTFGTTKDGLDSDRSLAHYLSRRMKLDREQVGQTKPYFINMSYEMKSVPLYDNTMISLVQEVQTYTGGAHTNTYFVPVNYDLRTGKTLALKDLFDENADYQSRLLSLMKIEAVGAQRIGNAMEKAAGIKGNGNPIYLPKAITGNEKFYINAKDASLTVFYNPGEIAPISEGRQNFDFSLDTIADIIKLGK